MIAQPTHYQAGSTIIEEGTDDRRLFVLMRGTLEIRKTGVLIVELNEPGTIVGEISAILGRARTCTVIAQTDCALQLLGADMDRIIQNDPVTTRQVMQELALRLEHTTGDYAKINHRLLFFKRPS